MKRNHVDRTGSWITYGSGDCNGWYAGFAGGGALHHSGDVCTVNEKIPKDYCSHFKQPVLETLTEEAVRSSLYVCL